MAMAGMLTRKEAAEMLGVSPETLDTLRREGHLAYVQHKANGKVWITEDAIREYIARITHAAKPVRTVQNTYRKRRVCKTV